MKVEGLGELKLLGEIKEFLARKICRDLDIPRPSQFG